jgi:hypothetical protein
MGLSGLTQWRRLLKTKTMLMIARPFRDAVLQDGIHDNFCESPVTKALVLKDLCYRGHGFLGQHGKETKTSWDTLSYTILQAHNVYQHMFSVQEANRQYEKVIFLRC